MLEQSKEASVLTMEQSEDVTINQQERLTSLVWLAGFLEGEGCVGFGLSNKRKTQRGNPRITPRIGLINTDYELIERANTTLQSLEIGSYIAERKNGCDGNPKHKSAKVLEVNGIKRVKKALEVLIPYMTQAGRKTQAAKLV